MLGEQLKEFRMGMTFSLSQTAKEIGISSSYLSQIENERRLPTKDILVKLIFTLSRYSTITEINKSEFINEQTYRYWRNLVEVDYDEEADWDTTVDLYDGNNILIDSIPDSAEDLENVIEDKLKNYFYNFSYRDISDYFDYNLGRYREAEKHRFARNVPIIDVLKLDSKLTEWWITYFKNKLESILKNNIQLEKQESKLYKYIIDFDFSNYSPTSVHDHSIHTSQLLFNNKKVVFDLDLIHHKNLTLVINGETISSKDLYALDLLVEGIKKKLE